MWVYGHIVRQVAAPQPRIRPNIQWLRVSTTKFGMYNSIWNSLIIPPHICSPVVTKHGVVKEKSEPNVIA